MRQEKHFIDVDKIKEWIKSNVEKMIKIDNCNNEI